MVLDQYEIDFEKWSSSIQFLTVPIQITIVSSTSINQVVRIGQPFDIYNKLVILRGLTGTYRRFCIISSLISSSFTTATSSSILC